MMRTHKKKVPVATVRFRAMIAGLLGVAALVAVPLLVVWKQSFITGASQRIEKMTDTLSAMNRQIAALSITRDRLATNERIETIARSLGLDYPSSDRIVVVTCEQRQRRGASAGDGVRKLLVPLTTALTKGGG